MFALRSGRLVAGFTLALLLLASTESSAQFFRQPAVGGVSISAEGVLDAPTVQDSQQLQAAWQNGMNAAPAEMEDFTELRFVSLRGIEAQLADAVKSGQPIPDSVAFLAGLQRVQFVLVYPDQNDVVLAGPAEGWKVDQLGNVVGRTTNRPVLLLDDLIVALRAGETSNGNGISCSIDPTPEGLARVQQVNRNFTAGMSPQVAAKQMEEALGAQVITVSGIEPTTHFARTIVAADFRMKRLAMNFEPAPVDGLPSYLQLARGASKNMLPRWWLAASYEPLAKSEDGLAWELRGQGVKCLTEEDFVDAEGNRRQSGQKSGPAAKWADLFSERFDELAGHDSAFGQLRNVMDLAIVSALIAKERLFETAEFAAPNLLTGYEVAKFSAPRSVATKASLLKKGGRWIISASGGVQVFPWQVADQTETSAEVAGVREEANRTATKSWWWQ